MDQSINPIGLIVTIASLSVLPLVAVTATSFLKISAVLLILRNTIGVQQVPSNMVLYGISMVMTLLVMGSILTEAGQRFAPDGKMPVSGTEVLESINASVPPFKKFMLANVNPGYLNSFHETAQKFQKKYDAPEVEKTDLFVVLPAFVASELAEAFRIGLYLYLPFVIIDLAVSSALMALGKNCFVRRSRGMGKGTPGVGQFLLGVNHADLLRQSGIVDFIACCRPCGGCHNGFGVIAWFPAGYFSVAGSSLAFWHQVDGGCTYPVCVGFLAISNVGSVYANHV